MLCRFSSSVRLMFTARARHTVRSVAAFSLNMRVDIEFRLVTRLS